MSDIPEYEDDAVDMTPKNKYEPPVVHCPICCHEVPSRCAIPRWCDFNIDEADVGVR